MHRVSLTPKMQFHVPNPFSGYSLWERGTAPRVTETSCLSLTTHSHTQAGASCSHP